jgi:hypothetical protein
MAEVHGLGAVVLSGVEVFTTDSSGNQVDGFVWNTVPGDSVPNAWVRTEAGYLDGPTDSLAPIMAVVPDSFGVGGGSGQYYFVVMNDFTFNPSYIGVSLWFNSSATPQISVFGSTSGLGHSPRLGFNDTFTDGTSTLKIGTQQAGSLGWSAPGAPIFDSRADVVGPFGVGGNGILDAGLLVEFTLVPEPGVFPLFAWGTFLYLASRLVRGCYAKHRSCFPNKPAAVDENTPPLWPTATEDISRALQLGKE